jgi:hypothetical protein
MAATDETGQGQKFQPWANSRFYQNVNPTTVASAVAQPNPEAYLTTVSGTAAMATIGLPYIGFTGTIAFRPTAAFTGVTGGTSTSLVGAIGLAFTAVVGKVLFMTYDGSLWWPSYVA